MFLLDCVDGRIPADLAAGMREEIEEERRLYLAMARTKGHLHLMGPQRFYTHAAPRRRRPARVGRARIIPPIFCICLNAAWPQAAAANPSPQAARRRRMWN